MPYLTRVAIVTLVVCAGIGSYVDAASAQSSPPPPGGWGKGYTDGGGVGIDAGDGASSTETQATGAAGHGAGSGSGSSGGATTCTAHGVTGPISSKPVPDSVIEGWYTSGGHPPPWAHGYDQPGTFYYVYCGGEYLNVEYIETGTTPPGGGVPAQAIDPRVLAVAASKNIRIGQFQINLNPAAPKDQLVGLPMWMWVSGDVTGNPLGTKSDTVTAGTVTVSATAKATQVVFDMGDHHQVTCANPDATTDPGPDGKTTCTYTYSRSSAPRRDHPGDRYTITATVVWAVNYTVAGAPGGGALPSITRTATTSVRVAEAQSLNRP